MVFCCLCLCCKLAGSQCPLTCRSGFMLEECMAGQLEQLPLGAQKRRSHAAPDGYQNSKQVKDIINGIQTLLCSNCC